MRAFAIIEAQLSCESELDELMAGLEGKLAEAKITFPESLELLHSEVTIGVAEDVTYDPETTWTSVGD